MKDILENKIINILYKIDYKVDRIINILNKLSLEKENKERNCLICEWFSYDEEDNFHCEFPQKGLYKNKE